MALTRKFLKSMGLTEEQVESVIDEHLETVNGLKEQVKQYKEDADKLPDTQKKLADVESELEGKTKELETATSWKDKYDKEKSDFAEYKTKVEADKTAESIRGLYRGLLKDANIDEKRFDTILKVTDLSGMKIGTDGKLEGADELTKSITSDWKDFIVKNENRPAEVDNPPATTKGNSMTAEQIMDIKDTAERQKAIADNPELFGLA